MLNLHSGAFANLIFNVIVSNGFNETLIVFFSALSVYREFEEVDEVNTSEEFIRKRLCHIR